MELLGGDPLGATGMHRGEGVAGTQGAARAGRFQAGLGAGGGQLIWPCRNKGGGASPRGPGTTLSIYHLFSASLRAGCSLCATGR